MDQVKERGSASIIVTLENGKIYVEHGTDDAVLAEWTAQAGDWDKIWQVIRALEAGNAIEIKEF
jgi:hypothetical protein